MFLTSGFSVSTTPISRLSCLSVSVSSATACPLVFSMMLPLSLGWKADSVRSNVDLPTPLEPNRQVSSPCAMLALMWLTTVFTLCFWV